eukprot:TRINITY_DN4828_c0_g4_i1.p1 TRINITY_DN4828_c0_g4~~TRINITY_DN4828_c0_g4_i1.p1  ORF type:complete len:721 (-),score=193.71 TRINITY_DN4828_c0_g4_i1:26-1963(-)
MKRSIGLKLLGYARRVYPLLGKSVEDAFRKSERCKGFPQHNNQNLVFEVGTPRSYAKFTKRPLGMVGSYRMNMKNSNLHAIPQNVASKAGIWCVGDTTWPGLGTVACVLGSKIAAKQIMKKMSFVPRRAYSSSSEPSNPFPTLSSSLRLSLRHLWDFVGQPEEVHKLLLKYAKGSSSPFVPIAFNPFDVVLLVQDAHMVYHILHRSQGAFQNRTSFPIVDYTYFKFVESVIKLRNGGNHLKMSHNMGGVTFTNGATWKKNRSIGVKAMNDIDFLLFCIPHIVKCAEEMSEKVNTSTDPSINLNLWISNLGIEVVGRVVFGTQLGALDGKSAKLVTGTSSIEASALVYCVRTMLNTIQKYIYLPMPSQLFSLFKTKTIRDLDQAVNVLATVGTLLMDQVRADLCSTSAPPGYGELSKSKCLAARLVQNYPELNEEELQALLMDLLGAGHDTTANLVIFTIGALLENPDILNSETLSQELSLINNSIPSSWNQTNVSQVLDIVELQTPFLSAILDESLRLYPLGAAFSRVSLKDVILENHKIPANAKILISPYVMGRLPQYWGEDVDLFRPSRFLEKSGNNRGFIPFGGGARGCLGGRFGILEAKLVIARFLHMSKLQKSPQWKPLDSILAFTLRTQHPIYVTLKKT